MFPRKKWKHLDIFCVLRCKNMRKTILRSVCFILFSQSVCADSTVAFDEEIKSPDSRVTVKLLQEESGCGISFSLNGKYVGNMKIAPFFSRKKVDICKARRRTVTSSWKPVWGFKAEYPDNYEEIAIDFSEPGKNTKYYSLDLRVYNEGIAARWSIVQTVYGNHYIEGENTVFSFPAESVAWPIPGTESTFPEKPKTISSLNGHSRWRMPLVLRVPNGMYASIMEARTVSFPRAYLKAKGNSSFCLDYVMGGKETRGECISPWRVVLLGETPGALVEQSYLVENLNDKCAIADTSWIKPGLAISDQGNFGFRTEEVLEAARLAAKLGCRYIQLDWGWYGTEYPWSDADRAHYLNKHPELRNDKTWVENTYANPTSCASGHVPYHPYWDYGGRNGVSLDMEKIIKDLGKLDIGLCLYIHDYVLSINDMDELFALYEKWGVKGLKPGFVGYGSQSATDHILDMSRIAAKHKLWLCIHDAHIPDGFERTWPNVMLTEGGGGAEGNHPVHQDVALPFTRCLSGPFDFTPVFYRKDTTKEHSLAFFIVYPGPSSVLRGSIKNFKEDDFKLFEFVKEIPWTYDDTIVPAGEISKYIAVCKRKSNKWFFGGMCAKDGVKLSFKTDFLEKGKKYKTRLWHNGTCKEFAFAGGDEWKIGLSPNDGFVAILEE